MIPKIRYSEVQGPTFQNVGYWILQVNLSKKAKTSLIVTLPPENRKPKTKHFSKSELEDLLNL